MSIEIYRQYCKLGKDTLIQRQIRYDRKNVHLLMLVFHFLLSGCFFLYKANSPVFIISHGGNVFIANYIVSFFFCDTTNLNNK